MAGRHALSAAVSRSRADSSKATSRTCSTAVGVDPNALAVLAVAALLTRQEGKSQTKVRPTRARAGPLVPYWASEDPAQPLRST